jgi:hypothetical protein
LSDTKTAPAHALPRDARVDPIGFAEELGKHFVTLHRDKVKLSMIEKSVDRVAGEYFEGLLICPADRGTIEARKLFRLVAAGKLTESQFLECVTVQRKAAEQYVAGKELDRMSSFTESTPYIKIARRKDVQLELVDMVKGLSAALAAKS